MAQNDKWNALYTGLRKDDCSNEYRLGVKKEKEEAADLGLSKVSDFETRIKNLEALYKVLKEMKERDDTESCGSS